MALMTGRSLTLGALCRRAKATLAGVKYPNASATNNKDIKAGRTKSDFFCDMLLLFVRAQTSRAKNSFTPTGDAQGAGCRNFSKPSPHSYTGSFINTRRRLLANKHYHLIGICGTAMASLAGMLVAQGHAVTGSDENVYPPMSLELKRLGIPVAEGYRPDNLRHRPDIVVIGNAISRGNAEVEFVLNEKLIYT